MVYNRLMDINFGRAVVLSILVHASIIMPICKSPIHNVERVDREKITVDYIRINEVLKKPVVNDLPQPTADTPRVAIPKKVEAAPVVNPVPESRARRATENISADELAKRQAAVRSTKDYIGYNQLIREKIRQRLKEKYRTYFGEGDVSLVFVLRADGTLLSSTFDPKASTGERSLIDTALRSLKDSSPFPRFPKGIDVPQMSFTLTVSFKRE